MTKEQIVDRISSNTGYMKVVVENVIDGLLSEVSDSLSRGERVQFTNFGTFSVKKRAAKIGRNFDTGAGIKIPEKFVAVFKAGKTLSENVGRFFNG